MQAACINTQTNMLSNLPNRKKVEQEQTSGNTTRTKDHILELEPAIAALAKKPEQKIH